MPQQKPSERQIAFLESRGIPVSELMTLPAIKRLITYLKQGNGTLGSTESERIGMTINYMKHWVGRRVYSRVQDDYGVVLYLFARTWEEVRSHAGAYLMGGNKSVPHFHPFQAYCVMDSGKYFHLYLSDLELCPDPTAEATVGCHL